jgi:inner membrane protein
LLPFWALLLGWVWSRVYGRPEARWQIVLIAGLALASQILTDVVTVFGTGILTPLSDWRPGLGITFVVDPWLTGLLAAVLVVSLLRDDVRLPRAGLVLLACMLAGHAMLQRAAGQVGRDYATTHGLDPGAVRAIAQPLSPLHWKIVVPDEQGYRMAHVRLTERPGFPPALADALGLGSLLQAYRAPEEAIWGEYRLLDGSMDDNALVRAVWQHPLLGRFRKFAAMPVLHRIDRDAAKLCVWFADLRYTLPSREPSFRYGLCRAQPDGPWQLYRIRHFTVDETEAL